MERLVAATFLSRPNRFIVRATIENGVEVDAHLADPGRLKELLVPGARLRLRPAKAGTVRRTRFGVALVRSRVAPRSWVSVETVRANDLAGGLLSEGAIRGIGHGWSVRREVRHGNSRFDFLLERPRGTRLWAEVKSVTLVENGIARFPDAPTSRGRRHIEELTAIVRGGGRALLLFVVQRGDARVVVPHRTIDPALADAVAVAREAGVVVRAAAFELSSAGQARYLGPLPVRSRT
jgi:sugar fermentation stimulation protein A